MRTVVFGAGSLGTAVGAALAASGRDVVLVARPERVAALRAQGGARVVTETGTRVVPVAAVASLAELRALDPEDRVLLTMKNHQLRDGLEELLARSGPDVRVFSFLNGVHSERRAALRFRTVYGVVARFACWSERAGEVTYRRPGSFVVGRHPDGLDARTELLVGDLREAGFEVGLSPRISEDKWLKLLVNLMNPPEALLLREPGCERRLHRLEALLILEGHAVLQAAGITAAPTGGIGRPPEEMARLVRSGRWGAPLAAPEFRARNSTWQSLRRGARLEDRWWTGEIVRLGEQLRLPTPLNRTMLRLLRRAARRGLGPECYTVRQLLRQARRGMERGTGQGPTMAAP